MMMFTQKKGIILILIAIFLVSCNNEMPQNRGSLPSNPAASVSVDIISPDASASQYFDYDNDFSSIQTTDGISIIRIKAIINDINPEYFEGLNLLQVVYSNPDARLNPADGMYYYDGKSITLWIYGESDGYIRYLLLHELKHHYCWNKIKENTDLHLGCFLSTPIDKEYGFIR